VGRNPKTGVEAPILPRRVMVFKPSNVLKAKINGREPRAWAAIGRPVWRRHPSSPGDGVQAVQRAEGQD
jgi:Bacterial DNA-binding protein